MELMTISQVSRGLGISTRTLRYYEQVGLLPSLRTGDYAYRMYDINAVERLRQIVVLRKLRIPLKRIGEILQCPDSSAAVDAFRQSIQEIDGEIEALSTIRGILAALAERLERDSGVRLEPGLFGDESMLALASSLSTGKNRIKEENGMEELNKADEKLTKLTDVRIVYLPPAWVAASHYVGENPERNASGPLDRFVKESDLTKLKPDLRHFGFNHPNPSETSPIYGYEMWVTIPDDMPVPSPLVKKQFKGGLYAAHMIPMGNFNEWEWLFDWANNNPDYEPDMADDQGECMYGLMEEHLNYVNHVMLENTEPEGMQLDLLLPVKAKGKTGGAQ